MRTIYGPATRGKRNSAKSPSRARMAITISILWVLPNAATSQMSAPDDRLQREWREIQVSEDRHMRKSWWQRLDLDQLNHFLAADAALNVADDRGWTPLHSAARYSSDPNILLALVQAGAVVDARDRSGDTPLHWAAAENTNVEIVTSLLSAGADVNSRDRFGWLPIHAAAEGNPNPEVIDALLSAGAQHRQRAYFVLFRPVFLLKHNSNMSDTDKRTALALLKEAD